MTKISKTYLAQLLLKQKTKIASLKGEAFLCAEITSWLKEATLVKDFPFVWFHVPNEFSGQYRGAFGASQFAMGKICGIPDYAFLGKDGCFFIEVKTPKSKLSVAQGLVRRWCGDVNVDHFVVRSMKEFLEVINERKENVPRK